MNVGNEVCIRYIDDFVIVGKTEKEVSQGFRKAKAILQRIGLTAYSPLTHPMKASQGEVIKGFDFVGCFINPTLTLPSVSARKSLADKIDTEIRQGLGIQLRLYVEQVVIVSIEQKRYMYPLAATSDIWNHLNPHPRPRGG